MIEATTDQTSDIQRLLARRAKCVRPGIVEKLADDLFGVSLPAILRDVDDDSMSAAFVISTADTDRSGDLVETDGIKTDNHRKNPVVLWDHGKGVIGRVPVGKCEDDSGQYTVVIRREEGVAVARVFFSKTLPFARDLWLLVKDKILRGASIAFRPLRARVMPGYSPDDEDAPLHLEEVDLHELSIVAVPDNSAALRIAMTKGVGGQRLGSDMVRQLDTMAKSADEAGRRKPPAKPGEKSTEGNRMVVKKKAAGEYLPMDDDGTVSADAMNETSATDGAAVVEDTDGDVAGKAVIADVPAAADVPAPADAALDAPPADAAVDTAADAPPDSPPGATAITALYDRLMDIGQEIEQQSKMQENPAVREALDDLAQTVEEKAKGLSGLHAQEYPHLDQLSDDAAVEGDDAIAADEGEEQDEATEGTIEKGARRVRTKSAAAQRLDRRLKKVREKRAATALAVKKARSAEITKAAAIALRRATNFLDQICSGAVKVGDGVKAVARHHCKAIKELAKLPVALSPDQNMAVRLKSAEETAEKYRQAAIKATKAYETAEKTIKRLKNKA